ncbi:MAG: LamG domain-containing protein, partial [Verrucomicrobiaceae bacterium]|nr:LamG domain-containing protein [Verrucomicrobiaceae bacterium]
AADQGTIYLDGQQDWTGQKNAPNGDGNLIIGARNNGEVPYLGLIDEVAVWTSALSADKILELAEGGSPTGGSPTPLMITDINANFSGANPVITISFNSKAGKIYAVDRTNDLLLWEELDDGIEGEGDSTEFVDSFLPEGTKVMFYRVRQVE